MKIILRYIVCLCFIKLLFLCDVYGQLDSFHLIPPLHSRQEPGPQYLYLSTPSVLPITLDLTTGTGGTVYDCNGIDISTVVISNAVPAILCIGLDYGSPLLVDISLLNLDLQDHGLIIKSQSQFYANLRIYTNNLAQAGSLTSKGQWSLGSHFRIGHIYSNNDPTRNKCHIIGVMATQDNTNIELKEYAAGLVFSGVNPTSNFILNKGECRVISVYVDAINPINDNGLMGCLLKSDKPVVVNCGSWDGSPNGSLRDMGIDQITPIKYVGNEYILVQGIGPTSLETPIVIADQDNTSVFINGNSIPDFVINAGEWRLLPTSTYTAQGNMYIQSNKDIVVYQMIGGANDPRTPGLNFIPTLSCLGDSIVDNIVDIDRIGNRVYAGGLMIVAHKNAWVEVNDNPVTVPAQPVSGNFDFVTYRILNGLSGNVKVSSSDNIQVGMYGYASPSGFAGYFSGFENFDIELDVLGSNCGDSIKANISNITYFEWYKDDVYLPGESSEILHVKGPGWYQLVGYQCEDERDSSLKIWIGRPDTVYLDSALCDPPLERTKIEHHINWTGCDSMTIINYSELPKDTIRIYNNSCFPEDTGTYLSHYINQFGCDSLIIHQISLSRTDTTDVWHLVCEPNEVRVEERILVNNEHCDSLVRDNYQLTDSYHMIEIFESCVGEVVDIGGRVFSEDIVFSDSLHTINDCDSIIEYHLTFHPTYHYNVFDTICNGDSILFEGDYFHRKGIYMKSYHTENNCDSTYQLNLEIFELPIIEFNDIEPYCIGDEILLSTKDKYDHYFWSTNSTLCCIQTAKGGSFNLQVTDSNGCINNKDIDVPNPISINSIINKQDIYCYGEQNGQIFIEFIEGGDSPYIIMINGKQQVISTINNLLEGTYNIQIIDQNGCSKWDTIEIIAPDFPFEIELNKDTTLRYGDYVNLNVDIIYGDLHNVEWYINDSLIDHDDSNYEFIPTQNVTVRVKGYDPHGCLSESYILIELYIDPRIYIPNVFSPNGDGVNDLFTIYPNDHISHIESFDIYSRWGELLFSGSNEELNSKKLLWDGKFNTKPLNNGVFVYHVVVVDIKGNRISKSGSVTLVK